MGIGMALRGFPERQSLRDTPASIRPSRRPEPNQCAGTSFPPESLGLRKIQFGPEVGNAVCRSEERARGVLTLGDAAWIKTSSTDPRSQISCSTRKENNK